VKNAGVAKLQGWKTTSVYHVVQNALRYLQPFGVTQEYDGRTDKKEPLLAIARSNDPR